LRPRLTLTFLLLLVPACAARPVPRQADRPLAESAPNLAVEFPPAGAVLGGPPTAFVAGRVAAGDGPDDRLDLVIAIDVSRSTCQAPGVPVVIGVETCVPSGPGIGPTPGRVADVEIAAARTLLARLDPARTRVGLVSIGGPVVRAIQRWHGPDAGFLGTDLELAPTADFAAVSAALDALAKREPDGPSNVAGALGRGAKALKDLPSPAPRRAILLLSDGVPSAPRETPRENLVETLRAASRAARDEVRVLSFAVGEAVDAPLAALEIAKRTNGAFYPVRDAADLPDLFALLQLEPIASVAVRNLTTGEDAIHERLGADGTWEALAPVAPGANRIEIRAKSEAGRETVREVAITFETGAASPPLPGALALRRDAAREAELALLASRRATLEREAADRARARIAETMVRERAAAVRAGERQRRDLALEAETPDVGAGPQN
jgi:hypothetical protein